MKTEKKKPTTIVMVNYNMIIGKKGNYTFITYYEVVITIVWHYKIDMVIIK